MGPKDWRKSAPGISGSLLSQLSTNLAYSSHAFVLCSTECLCKGCLYKRKWKARCLQAQDGEPGLLASICSSFIFLLCDPENNYLTFQNKAEHNQLYALYTDVIKAGCQLCQKHSGYLLRNQILPQ